MTIPFVSLPVAILVLSFETAHSQCHLCGTEDVSIQNPDAPIALLKIPGPTPTICQVAYNYAQIIDESDPLCEQLQQQAVYCQCSNAVAVPDDQACDLCNDGSLPLFPDRVTPYGETCQELNQYLKSLTKDQCQNPKNYRYLEEIKNTAFGCGCQGSTATCPMCQNDQSINISNPDRVIPFLSFIDVGGGNNLVSERSNPTCRELAMLASTDDSSSSLCQMARDNAGFCGCPGVSPQNKCTFCPDGNPPARENYIVPTLDNCGELNAYMSFMSEDECQSERAREMQALDYLCGCKDSEPQCTLCQDGANDLGFDPDIRPTEDGSSCLDLALSMAALPSDTCEEQRNTIIGMIAFRCGCSRAQVPVCATRQNSHLCTQELLDHALQSEVMTDEDKRTCECFAFCNGEFVKCQDYPGGVLTSQICPGVPVSGCNAAVAMANKNNRASGGAKRIHRNITALVIAVGLVLASISIT